MPTSVKPRPKKHVYIEEAMQAACQAVREEKKAVREVARLYGVPPTTLSDHLKGKKAFHEVQRTVITAPEEERLVSWIKESSRRGFGRTMANVQQAVQAILNGRKAVTVFKDNLPGRKWVSLFLKRHPDITLRTPQALGAQRAAVTENKLRGWFQDALLEIQSYGGDVLDHPSRIFNCNETGFKLGGGGFAKVLANKGDKHVYQISNYTHSNNCLGLCKRFWRSSQPTCHIPWAAFFVRSIGRFSRGSFRPIHKWVDLLGHIHNVAQGCFYPLYRAPPEACATLCRRAQDTLDIDCQ